MMNGYRVTVCLYQVTLLGYPGQCLMEMPSSSLPLPLLWEIMDHVYLVVFRCVTVSEVNAEFIAGSSPCGDGYRLQLSRLVG